MDAMAVIHLSKITLLLNLKVIGTPTIVRWMFEEGIIDKKKAVESLEELKKIGWFERGLLDRIVGEVEIDG